MIDQDARSVKRHRGDRSFASVTLFVFLLSMAGMSLSFASMPAPDLYLEDGLGQLYEPVVEPEMLYPIQLSEAGELYRTGEYRLSLLMLQRIDTLNIPDGTRDIRLLMMAECYRKLDLGGMAVSLLTELFDYYTESPLRVFAAYRLQDYYYRQRDIEKTDSLCDLFARQYRLHPLRAASLYLSAKGHVRALHYDRAIDILQGMPRESDFYSPALLLQGLCMAAKGDSTRALLKLDAAAGTESNTALRDEARLLQGDLYFRMHKFETALRMYNFVSPEGRRTEDVSLRKAFVYLELKQYTAALRMARKVLKEAPESRHVFEIALVLERAYRALGDERNSIKSKRFADAFGASLRCLFVINDETRSLAELETGWDQLLSVRQAGKDESLRRQARTEKEKVQKLRKRLEKIEEIVDPSGRKRLLVSQGGYAQQRYMGVLYGQMNQARQDSAAGEAGIAKIAAKLESATDSAAILRLNADLQGARIKQEELLAKAAHLLREQDNLLRQTFASGSPASEAENLLAKFVDWGLIRYGNLKGQIRAENEAISSAAARIRSWQQDLERMNRKEEPKEESE